MSIPRDSYGWVLLLVSAFIAILTYFCRLNADRFFLELGLGVVFFFVAFSPILLFIGLAFVFHVGATLQYAMSKRQIIPSVILFGGMVISLFLLPLPPSPEENAFAMHKQEYQRLVELARSDQLLHSDRCRGSQAFSYPENYQHLKGEYTAGNCIFVEKSPVFSVTFSPRSFYRPIVYIEEPAKVENTIGACGRDGTIRKRLDNHWFICNRDFN
jgi:hypothetical protein